VVLFTKLLIINNLTIFLKAGVSYFTRVNLKRPLHSLKAPGEPSLIVRNSKEVL